MRGRRRRTMATARPIPRTIPAAAARLLNVSRRWMPRPGSSSSVKPAAGTSAASTPLFPPTKWIDARGWPRSASAAATAKPGSRWPPVPPPAKIAQQLELSGWSGPSGTNDSLATLPRHVEQDAGRAHRGQEARAAERDERERHAGDGQDADDRADVDERLHAEPRRDADGEEAAEVVACPHRGSHPEEPEANEEPDDEQRTDDTELLADDGEDEVGVGEGQERPLRARGADADTEPPAGRHAHLRLDRLVARVERVLPRVHEREQPGAAVALAHRRTGREQHARRAVARERAERHAGGEEHRERDRRDDDRRAEVRLHHDQTRDHREHDEDRAQRDAGVGDPRGAPREELRGEQ